MWLHTELKEFLVFHHITDLTVVNADPRTGKVSPEDVLSALQPSTCLVSIMLANNETGIIQPVQKIVEAVREWDRGRAKDVKKKKVFVHTDAAQVKIYSGTSE